MTTLSSPLHPSLREILNDAIRYWEPRRIVYNLLLAMIVIGWTVATWPHFAPAVKFEPLLALLILAVLANGCYCAAYVVDVTLQFSDFRTAWRRYRWLLWSSGTLFALALAYYWIGDEIYPAFGIG